MLSARTLAVRIAALALAGLVLAAPVAQAQVEVQSLAKLDLFSSGRETGFGPDVWKGASADIARAVIPTLAARPLSPAGASLARRLLAQTATAPDGAGGDADLAAARVKALLALGEAPLVGEILDHTPNLSQDGALSQTAAEVALDLGQDQKACGIGEALTVDRSNLYWLRLRAFCQALAGKTEAAQLTFTLASQQGKDPVLARLMGVLLNGAGDPGPASLRNGLEYALSRHFNLDLTPALPGANPAIADQIAAARAAAASASAPAPVSLPSDPEIVGALKAAKTFSAFVIAAKAEAPAIAAAVQAKTPLADPILDASAALAAGDVDTAQAIRAALAEPNAPTTDPLSLAILDAALAAAVGRPDAPTLDRLIERGGVGDARGKGRAQAAAAIFAGLGGEISNAGRAQFVGFDLGRSDVSAAKMIGLEADAEAGRVGETALLVLSAAQGGGAAGPPPADRARIVRALTKVGRKADAQAFAVEGLLMLQAR